MNFTMKIEIETTNNGFILTDRTNYYDCSTTAVAAFVEPRSVFLKWADVEQAIMSMLPDGLKPPMAPCPLTYGKMVADCSADGIREAERKMRERVVNQQVEDESK
jgi:hypothetical protein